MKQECNKQPQILNYILTDRQKELKGNFFIFF